jgi:hypothetical protein
MPVNAIPKKIMKMTKPINAMLFWRSNRHVSRHGDIEGGM